MNKSPKSINQVKRMLNASTERYLLKLIIKITTFYHLMKSEDRVHKSGWISADHITTFLIFLRWYLANLFFFVNDRYCFCLQETQAASADACPNLHSILLSKNYQKVFFETDHTDRNIQSFDAAEDRKQTSSGFPPDHDTTCFIFLH
jgi:hypothetical protein